jgi:hypothetical protein
MAILPCVIECDPSGDEKGWSHPMKIDISYNYPINYVPFRHQNTQHVWAAAKTTVDIREFSDAEAPVVVRVGAETNEDSYKQSPFLVRKDGTPVDIRQVEGVLYLEHSDAALLQAAVNADINATALKGSVKQFDQDTSNKKIWTYDDVVNAHREPLRTITDDKGAALAASMQKNADRLIIVDGKIFQRTRQPVLAINLDEGFAQILRAPKSADPYGISNHDFRSFDIICNLEEAPAVLSKLPQTISIEGVWDIRNSDFATFDGTTFDIVRRFDQMFEQLSCRVPSLPRDALDLFFAFREERDRADGSITPMMLDLAADAARMVIDEAEISNAKNLAVYLEQRRRKGGDFARDDRFGHSANPVKNRSGMNNEDFLINMRSMAERIALRWDLRPDGWEEKNAMSVGEDVSVERDGHVVPEMA